jgi:hypothetical protein
MGACSKAESRAQSQEMTAPPRVVLDTNLGGTFNTCRALVWSSRADTASMSSTDCRRGL